MDNRELKKILDKLYKMYIYDEEVCTIKDNEAVSKITDKLIELCAYRKNDFQQGLMIGLALNKFSQSFINTDVLNKWMTKIYNEEYHGEG